MGVEEFSYDVEFIGILVLCTVVFRFKHVRFMQDFQFKQDFTLPKMKE